MKLYQMSEVGFTYQNFGSTWLGVLRGTKEEILSVFSGLYNLRATNGDCQFFDHMQTIGLFWTDKRAMLRFFFNQLYLRSNDRSFAFARHCLTCAYEKLKEMTEEGNHEEFLSFTNGFVCEPYSVGVIRAEKPDNDFKDSVLAFAFSAKE